MSARETIAAILENTPEGQSEWGHLGRSEQILDALRAMTAPDRLALARALVADTPGVVVARVPDAWLVPAEKNTPYNKGRRRGWNDFRTELISAGSATPHQPKEDVA